MMKKSWLILATLTLLTLLTKTTLNQPCEATTKIPNLFQDTINFQLSLPQSQHLHQYQYQYPNKIFQNPPKIALSFSTMEIKSISSIQYQIAAVVGAGGEGKIVFYLLMGGDGRWRNLRVEVVGVGVGGEVDGIAIGYGLFERVNQMTNKTMVFTQKQQPLLAKLNLNNPTNPKIFLSSFLGLQITFSPNNLDFKATATITKKPSSTASDKPPTHTIQFFIQASNNTNIKSARFCYVVYVGSRLSKVRGYFGGVEQVIGKNGIARTVLQPLTIFPATYSLIGITGIRTATPQMLSFTTTLHLTNLDYLQSTTPSPSTSPSSPSLSLSYFILGYDMMITCINCPDSFIKHTQNATTYCVKRTQCQPDEITVVDPDGIYYSCRKCGADSVVVVKADGKICGCRAGWVQERDGGCRRIQVYRSVQECSDPNSVRDPVTGRCVCKEGYEVDDFGFCGGCNQVTSYWDLNTQKCTCLPGYQMDQNLGTCVQQGHACPQNQIFKSNSCQCQDFLLTVSTPSQPLSCQQCPSNTYKKQSQNSCQKCPTSCLQCISNMFCLSCQTGYFFKDFLCQARCGDGVRVGGEACDDGSYQGGDGCGACGVEDGWECVEDGNGLSKCTRINVPIVHQTPIVNNITIKPDPLPPHKQIQPTEIPPQPVSQPTPQPQPPTQYRLSISKNSPTYLSSGIVLQLLIKPQKKRTQQQLKSIFKIEVSDSRCLPPSIFISQDQNRLSSIRCYLHYNNQLPVYDFSIKVWAMLGENVWRSLTVYSKVSGKLARALQTVDDDSYLL